MWRQIGEQKSSLNGSCSVKLHSWGLVQVGKGCCVQGWWPSCLCSVGPNTSVKQLAFLKLLLSLVHRQCVAQLLFPPNTEWLKKWFNLKRIPSSMFILQQMSSYCVITILRKPGCWTFHVSNEFCPSRFPNLYIPHRFPELPSEPVPCVIADHLFSHLVGGFRGSCPYSSAPELTEGPRGTVQ